MTVNFTPELREQLKARRVAAPAIANHPVIIMVCNKAGRNPVPNVDPVTRSATGDAQQFLKHADNSLTVLPRSQWVANPTVIEVGYMKLG